MTRRMTGSLLRTHWCLGAGIEPSIAPRRRLGEPAAGYEPVGRLSWPTTIGAEQPIALLAANSKDPAKHRHVIGLVADAAVTPSVSCSRQSRFHRFPAETTAIQARKYQIKKKQGPLNGSVGTVASARCTPQFLLTIPESGMTYSFVVARRWLSDS